MVLYTCPICSKEFNKKSNFINHTVNKKNSCEQNHKKSQLLTNINKKSQLLTNFETYLTNVKSENSCCCNYCNKSFFNIYSLKRHYDKCKIKMEEDVNKKNIFELLLEEERKRNELLLEQEKKEKQILNNKVDELQKQLLDLTKTIKELSSKSATIINNNNYGNVNNITIPLDKLSKFGKEDLTKITQREFLKIKNYQGVAIFMETAKLIYNNHSVNKTVYVADYSRKKAMIWNGERWVLTCLEEVLDVMKERIRTLYNINIDMIEDDRIIKDFETRVQKYFDMLYDEYDEEKKEDKKFIERVNSLQEKYGNDLMLWLTNIKKDVITNYNNIVQTVYKDNDIVKQSKLIELEPEFESEFTPETIIKSKIETYKKPRGRPRKI